MAKERPYLIDVTRMIWRRWSGRLPTGIDRVCLAYLQHFRESSQAVIQRGGLRRILPVDASERLFDLLTAGSASVRPGLAAALGTAALRPSLDGANRLYLNIGHTGLGDPGLAHWVRRARLRPIHFVHDLIPITHPEFCRAGEAERHHRRIVGVMRTATGVVANSQATLAELERFRQANDLPRVPTLAAQLGSDAMPVRAGAPRRAGRPTFVILGTIEARKNHMMLLQLWQRLVARLGDQAPRLTIIGQRGWECDDVFALLDSGALGEAVTEIGRADDGQLADHLAGARALLFPSLIEGYGLPLVEALRAGTPVIASDLPVFREIGAGVPDLLDPLDPVQWERAILDYSAAGSAARKAQLARLAGFRAPSWSGHFDALERWLAGIGHQPSDDRIDQLADR